MNNNLANPRYYLENFRFVLAWVLQRYAALLAPDEIAFIRQFSDAPAWSQALLVRMIMRRGNLFRTSKLIYPEIGDPLVAAQALIAQGWITSDPLITVDQLYALLTKKEFTAALRLAEEKNAKKTDLLAVAKAGCHEARRFSAWCGNAGEVLYEVAVDAMCERFRLMFFGNLYQDWSEFVLADLGVFSYEKVAFSDSSRAFQDRRDIDSYLHLSVCRERLQDGALLREIESEVDAVVCTSPWLQRRQKKLRFQIAQLYEKQDNNADALRIYAQCDAQGARLRRIRVLEKLGSPAAALDLAAIAQANPESSAETQQLGRIMPRLRRRLGHPRLPAPAGLSVERIQLAVPRPAAGECVEQVARQHIQALAAQDESGPVYYVENTLINSLFGLLCWEAVFSPVPGAFFHPFQTGPADLLSADFHSQRAELFEQALSQLRSGQYQHTIRATFKSRHGILSPFVCWELLDATLLDLALACLPGAHLEKMFERLLADIGANRSGFPDLIQFWPRRRRYRMIEVKGPGDRLQDNQIRFLEFCAHEAIPVAVCHVEWTPEGGRC